jgi:sugar phosphate permease
MMSEKPYRWFPGYTVAAVSTLGYIATAPGQTFVLSLLNTSLSETFKIEPLALNGAYTLATVAAAFPLVYVGRMVDRLGPRRAMTLIALLFAAGCLAMAGAQGVVTVFLAFFLLRFFGQGSLSLVSQHALAMWFHRRLGSMHGFIQVALFGVWTGVPGLTIVLIQSLGWRWTYVLFGAAIAIVIPTIALRFLRNRPEDVGLQMDNDLPESPSESQTPTAPRHEWTLRDALRTRQYWTLVAAMSLTPLIGTALLFDMQPILARRGHSETAAAVAASVWPAAMALMALPSGYVTDRLRPAILMSLGVFVVGVSSLCLWLVSASWNGSLSMALFAVGQSLVASSGAATVARYFGRAHHGAIRASVTRLGVIGTGLGPICTGLSANQTGAYSAALIGFAIICAPVALLSMTLRPPAHKH